MNLFSMDPTPSASDTETRCTPVPVTGLNSNCVSYSGHPQATLIFCLRTKFKGLHFE